MSIPYFNLVCFFFYKAKQYLQQTFLILSLFSIGYSRGYRVATGVHLVASLMAVYLIKKVFETPLLIGVNYCFYH
jgi:hypothetical protein